MGIVIDRIHKKSLQLGLVKKLDAILPEVLIARSERSFFTYKVLNCNELLHGKMIISSVSQLFQDNSGMSPTVMHV